MTVLLPAVMAFVSYFLLTQLFLRTMQESVTSPLLAFVVFFGHGVCLVAAGAVALSVITQTGMWLTVSATTFLAMPAGYFASMYMAMRIRD